MASTATNHKRTQSNGDAEDPNRKRRETKNSSSIAKVNKRKPSVKPAPKRTANKKIDSKDTIRTPKKPAKRSAKTPPEPLANMYYFNAPQEPNSNPEWIDYDTRVATPEEIQYAIEAYCVGWTDEELVEEREERKKKLWG